jgi:g-D-glutamyl-meso-diaminopimelate peptidase
MFGYSELSEAVKGLDKSFVVESIGKSAFGREIFSIRRGKGDKALLHGGIHAREHITAKLVFELAASYRGENITFVPLVNPDGAELCIRGLDTVPSGMRGFLKKVNSKKCDTKNDFSLWKANGRAVDLNNNFDADWGKGVGNVTKTSSAGYIGKTPFSECESKALRDLTLKRNFEFAISYHSKGEVIYWGYGDNYLGKDIALRFAELTGYRLEKSEGSTGGYKDWFTLTTGKLSLTIEVGDDNFSHPFPYSQFDAIMEKNKGVTALIDKEFG